MPPVLTTEQVVRRAKNCCKTGDYAGAIHIVTGGLARPAPAPSDDDAKPNHNSSASASADPHAHSVEDDTVRLLLLRAHMWLKQGDCHEALKDTKVILKMREDVKHAYMVQGEAYMLLNQFAKASETFLAGVELFPSDLVLAHMLKNSVQGVRQKWHQYYNSTGYKLAERGLTEHQDMTKETSNMKALRRGTTKTTASRFARQTEEAKKEAGASLDIHDVVRDDCAPAGGGSGKKVGGKGTVGSQENISECYQATVSLLLDFKPVLEVVFKYFCLDPVMRRSTEAQSTQTPKEQPAIAQGIKSRECVETLQAYLHHIYGLPKDHFLECLQEISLATDAFPLTEVDRALQSMGSVTARLPTLMGTTSGELPALVAGSEHNGSPESDKVVQKGIPATLSFPKFLEALIHVICARC
jgi:hypothetical protein